MSDQGELFKAETTWFHVFKSMIDSGDLAEMSGSSLKVYLVVKSYTNFSTGRSFPALETIAEKSGLSVSQVKRCLKELGEHSYITKEKKGRNNLYTMREKVEYTDSEGRPKATATWDYLPSTVRQAQAELKRFKMTGEALEGGIINIESLTINIANDNAQQININAADLSKLTPDMQEQIKSMMEKQKARDS